MGEMRKSATFGELINSDKLAVGDGYRAKLDELGGTGPYFLRAGALTDQGFVWEGLDAFDENIADSLGEKIGHAGDVVITTKGNSIGRVGCVPQKSPRFAYSPHLSYWRSKDHSSILPRYLYYWSRSDYFTRQLRNLAFATDMAPYLSLRDQLMLTITLPPIDEQRAIAEVLGALDDKIAVNDKIVQRSKSVMTALISKLNNQVPLSSLARQTKKTLAPTQFDSEVAHFSLPAFDEGETPELTTSASIKSNKFALENPCVLMSKLNPRIPRIWDVSALPGRMAVASTEFIVLEPEGISSTLLWASLNDPSVSARVASTVAGTSGSHQRIKPSELLELPVRNPQKLSASTQEAITDLGKVSRMRGEENQKLSVTRDSLLPLLMSGKVRVRDAEKVVEETV